MQNCISNEWSISYGILADSLSDYYQLCPPTCRWETQSILGMLKPCLERAAPGRSWAEEGQEKGREGQVEAAYGAIYSARRGYNGELSGFFSASPHPPVEKSWCPQETIGIPIDHIRSYTNHISIISDHILIMPHNAQDVRISLHFPLFWNRAHYCFFCVCMCVCVCVFFFLDALKMVTVRIILCFRLWFFHLVS